MELIITNKTELESIVKNAISEVVETFQPKTETALDYYDSKEICAVLGISTSNLSNLKREKKIPYYQIGKKVVFSKSKIEEWMQRNERGQK